LRDYSKTMREKMDAWRHKLDAMIESYGEDNDRDLQRAILLSEWTFNHPIHGDAEELMKDLTDDEFREFRYWRTNLYLDAVDDITTREK